MVRGPYKAGEGDRPVQLSRDQPRAAQPRPWTPLPLAMFCSTYSPWSQVLRLSADSSQNFFDPAPSGIFPSLNRCPFQICQSSAMASPPNLLCCVKIYSFEVRGEDIG